MYTVFN